MTIVNPTALPSALVSGGKGGSAGGAQPSTANQFPISDGSGGWSWSPLPLFRVANTAAAGVALINGTQTIVSWTAPNDGALHRVLIVVGLNIATVATGGDISVNVTPNTGVQILSTGSGRGYTGWMPVNGGNYVVLANATVAVVQSSALTAGSGTVYAEIWAS